MVVSLAHPLDPLTADELSHAVDVFRGERGLGEETRFINLELDEPEKAELRAWRDGGARPSRRAFAVLLDTASGMAAEAVADLEAGTVVRWTSLEGQQPAISADEFFAAAGAVKRDPRYREALARRGIEGDAIDLVHIEPWATGMFETGGRLARALSWIRSAADDPNPYARPIGRLIAVIDLSSMEVVRVDDHGALPLPQQAWDYRDGGGAPYRDDLREIEITQPDGPSFTLEGRELRWQRWRLRVGFSNREGLVLHEIGYEDGGGAAADLPPGVDRRAGDPLRRPQPDGALQERVRHRRVRHGPAGQPAGAGLRLPGRDPLSGRRPRRRLRAGRWCWRNAICIHEEDFGILWKHRDDNSGHPTWPAPAGWSCPASPRWATTSTASSGTSTRTGRSSSRAS